MSFSVSDLPGAGLLEIASVRPVFLGGSQGTASGSTSVAPSAGTTPSPTAQPPNHEQQYFARIFIDLFRDLHAQHEERIRKQLEAHEQRLVDALLGGECAQSWFQTHEQRLEQVVSRVLAEQGQQRPWRPIVRQSSQHSRLPQVKRSTSTTQRRSRTAGNKQQNSIHGGPERKSASDVKQCDGIGGVAPRRSTVACAFGGFCSGDIVSSNDTEIVTPARSEARSATPCVSDLSCASDDDVENRIVSEPRRHEIRDVPHTVQGTTEDVESVILSHEWPYREAVAHNPVDALGPNTLTCSGPDANCIGQDVDVVPTQANSAEVAPVRKRATFPDDATSIAPPLRTPLNRDTSPSILSDGANSTPLPLGSPSILNRIKSVRKTTVLARQDSDWHAKGCKITCEVEQLRKEASQKRILRSKTVRHRWHGHPVYYIMAVAQSRTFEIVVCSVIVVNALFIGLTVDLAMRNPNVAVPVVIRVFELLFLTFYSFELALRVICEEIGFFSLRNSNVKWNVFDTCLVVLALCDEVVALTITSSRVNTFRMFRMLRVIRIFRVVRVMRFFKELRQMVRGIMNSIHALMWALILLCLIKYVCAMCVLQFAAMEAELKAEDSQSGSLSDEEFQDLTKFYGSLPKTIWTLFLSICGGVDWGDVAAPLLGLHWSLGLCFAFYIAFAVFCVLNIVTGVFVENANKMTSEDYDLVLMEQLENRTQWFNEVRDIFEAADADGSGYLNGEEFTSQIRDDVRLQAQFRKIGVHVEAYSAAGLFQLLDFDGDGRLDLDEFCLALQQVHGNARSIDVAKLTHDTRVLRKTTRVMMEMVLELFCMVQSSLGLDDSDVIDAAIELLQGPAGSQRRSSMGSSRSVMSA